MPIRQATFTVYWQSISDKIDNLVTQNTPHDIRKLTSFGHNFRRQTISHMITRIVIQVVITLSMVLLAVMHHDTAQQLLTLGSLLGIVAILETIRTFKKLHLQNDVLTIKQSFGRTKSFSLNHVSNWKEHNYYMRGHLQRTLILFLPDEEKIVISIYNDVDEFEKLFNYLKVNLSECGDWKT